jgi:hypothetical protein
VVMKSIIFWDMTPLKLNGLHGVISQKMILFKNIINLHFHCEIYECGGSEVIIVAKKLF